MLPLIAVGFIGARSFRNSTPCCRTLEYEGRDLITALYMLLRTYRDIWRPTNHDAVYSASLSFERIVGCKTKPNNVEYLTPYNFFETKVKWVKVDNWNSFVRKVDARTEREIALDFGVMTIDLGSWPPFDGKARQRVRAAIELVVARPPEAREGTAADAPLHRGVRHRRRRGVEVAAAAVCSLDVEQERGEARIRHGFTEPPPPPLATARPNAAARSSRMPPSIVHLVRRTGREDHHRWLLLLSPPPACRKNSGERGTEGSCGRVITAEAAHCSAPPRHARCERKRKLRELPPPVANLLVLLIRCRGRKRWCRRPLQAYCDHRNSPPLPP
nr:hypothetical protein Iba_chr12aCG11410 [Ipomoea batatas]